MEPSISYVVRPHRVALEQGGRPTTLWCCTAFDVSADRKLGAYLGATETGAFTAAVEAIERLAMERAYGESAPAG